MAQWCLNCEFRWLACDRYCRGYEVFIDEQGRGHVRGCHKCCDGQGVPDEIAQTWPESFRAVANALQERKGEELLAVASP